MGLIELIKSNNFQQQQIIFLMSTVYQKKIEHIAIESLPTTPFSKQNDAAKATLSA